MGLAEIDEWGRAPLRRLLSPYKRGGSGPTIRDLRHCRTPGAAMDYTVSLDRDLGAVRVRITGPQTLAICQAALIAAIAAARPARVSRFLVDVKEATTGIDTFDLFDLIANFDEYGFKHGDRIAVALAVARSNPKTDQWGELVAENRGWQVRAFETVEEAEASLLA